MQKKTRFRSPLLDVFVTVLCISVSAFFLFLFWKDLNQSIKRTDKDDIATITFKNRIAQRKFEDRVVWERLAQSSPLYNGDLVRTSDLSEAIITFLDGSVLELYENTMIQVYYSETEGINVSVDGGSVQLDSSVTGKASLALTDGSVVKVESGSSLGAKSEKGSLSSVQVKSGSASLTTESGSSENLRGGETVSIHSGSEIKKAPLTVTSLPEESRLLSVEGTKVPVLLEWAKSSSIENSDVVVEVSKKKDFSEIVETAIVKDTGKKSLDLDSGSYYWKVYPKGMPESAVSGKVSVESVEPVVPLFPSKAATLSSREDSRRVDFNWNGNPYATSYDLKVSKYPDMKSPVVEKNVTDTSVTLTLPEDGRWWWTVTPVYALSMAGEVPASTPVSFDVKKLEKINPPLLSAPADAANITYKKDDTDPSVNFLWKSELKNSSYLFELSENKDFSRLIYSKEMEETNKKLSFPVSLLSGEKEGSTFWWRVTRKSGDELDTSPVSEIHSFTLKPYEPGKNRLLYPPETFSVEKEKLASLQFTWKKADEYEQNPSVMQFSRTKDFSKIEKEVTSDKASLQGLSGLDGSLWWRVASLSEDDQKLLFSEARRISILEKLASPVFTLPGNTELISYKSSPVRLSWSGVAGADYYNARIFGPDGKLVSENASVSAKTAEFVLPPANYTARLSAVASGTENSPMRQSNWSELNFTVREVEPLVQLYPEPGKSLDGLSCLQKPLTFTWKEGKDSALTYQVVLKKRQTNGALKTVEKLTSSKMSASIDRLTSGSYVWEVVASTSSGFPINSGEKTFTIGEVPLLGKPILTNPGENILMDAQYLRKHRNLSFEWNEVPQANSYNFSLYKKEKDGSLKAVWSQRNVRTNKVRLKNLTILDTGDFVWKVDAFNFAKDGFELQHSPSSQASFRIQFAAPSKIEASSPGIMYSD